METLKVDLGKRSYNITIGYNILKGLGEEVRKFKFSPKAALISNPTVYKLYGDVVLSSLRSSGLDVQVVLIPDGEEYKEFGWAYYILGRLLAFGLDRKSVIFALGGGVIGDITGFVASVYMRGIACIQIPTTLLSQVDSSVGGKTGVNHPLGKNMIGTFYQPRLVWIDVESLKSLPEREFLAGMAEVIKYGVIWDEEFFSFLEKNCQGILSQKQDLLVQMIKRCCEIKAEVVSKDERESGLRAILNYGHTVGHAIETLTGYTRYLHGEAVSMGMVYEAEIAREMELIDTEAVKRLRSLISSYGMASKLEESLNPEQMIRVMQIDKKALSGRLRIVLPERIGKVQISSDIDNALLQKVLSR